MKFSYPSLSEVFGIHQALIGEFGGTPGVREMGALEAALMRPQLGYYADLPEEAAALMESLANNHPFLDGNKRVAFAATDLFLRQNGQYIDCQSKETYQQFMQWFETGQFQFANLHAWLRTVVKPL